MDEDTIYDWDGPPPMTLKIGDVITLPNFRRPSLRERVVNFMLRRKHPEMLTMTITRICPDISVNWQP
jgi:hypothetical protein